MEFQISGFNSFRVTAISFFLSRWWRRRDLEFYRDISQENHQNGDVVQFELLNPTVRFFPNSASIWPRRRKASKYKKAEHAEIYPVSNFQIRRGNTFRVRAKMRNDGWRLVSVVRRDSILRNSGRLFPGCGIP